MQQSTSEFFQNITLPGLPRNERYTIQIRCIRNHIEGPSLIVSSRAEFNSESGSFQDNPNLPRSRLACIGSRTFEILTTFLCSNETFHTVDIIF